MASRTDDAFRNVDLEIRGRTRRELAPLLDYLDEHLSPLYAGRVGRTYLATYESCDMSRFRRRGYTPTTVIDALADVLDAMPTAARRAWNAASTRDFDVGVDVARGAWGLSFAVESDAVRRVARLGARVVFTVYQPPARGGRG